MATDESTMTSKGQTTIPVRIRKQLRLKPGSRLLYVVQDDGSVVIRPTTFSALDLPTVLPKPKHTASLEDIESAIRARRARGS